MNAPGSASAEPGLPAVATRAYLLANRFDEVNTLTNLLAAFAPAYVVPWPTLMQADAIRQICFLASRYGATHGDRKD